MSAPLKKWSSVPTSSAARLKSSTASSSATRKCSTPAASLPRPRPTFLAGPCGASWNASASDLRFRPLCYNNRMLTPTEKIWHNGRFIKWDDAKIHVLSHVVSYGSSIFEGIRCYATPDGPAVFRLHEHVRRMADSCKI